MTYHIPLLNENTRFAETDYETKRHPVFLHLFSGNPHLRVVPSDDCCKSTECHSDHLRLTFYHNGLERRLTNVHGQVEKDVLA